MDYLYGVILALTIIIFGFVIASFMENYFGTFLMILSHFSLLLYSIYLIKKNKESKMGKAMLILSIPVVIFQIFTLFTILNGFSGYSPN